MSYLHWNSRTITDFSAEAVAAAYADGYVFTRLGKGAMQQTRSVRIDVKKFELSSENRRILKKVGGVTLETEELPLPAAAYDWKLGKLAKDFYDAKFGPGIMSAQKIKEMLTDAAAGNFNRLFIYRAAAGPAGYAISYENAELLHYSYPFYDLELSPKDMGLGMMIMAIRHARESGRRYVYLGSLQRPTDTYKLQFAGLEWFDGGPDGSGTWSSDLETVKKLLASAKIEK